MPYEILQYDDHSIKGYLLRQPITVVKGELGRLLLLEKERPLSDYDLSYKALLTEILQLRGERTDIDTTSIILPLPSNPSAFILTDK